MEKKASTHACLHHGFKGRELEILLGDVPVHTFRLIYGGGFAPAFCAARILREVLPMLDKPSLDKLLSDSKNGVLTEKIARALEEEQANEDERRVESATRGLK